MEELWVVCGAGERPADGEGPPRELIYEAYPRREGHRVVLQLIVSGRGKVHPTHPRAPEAQIYLYKCTRVYAQSPAGSRTDKTLIPHPATWFNRSRYLDDASAEFNCTSNPAR